MKNGDREKMHRGGASEGHHSKEKVSTTKPKGGTPGGTIFYEISRGITRAKKGP